LIAFGPQHTLKAQYAEGSPASGEIRFGDLLHACKSHASILLCRAMQAAPPLASDSGQIARFWRKMRHFRPKTADFGLKKGQNRGFSVTL
jgi:hypothetical protein